jgi:hypothetical protein
MESMSDSSRCVARFALGLVALLDAACRAPGLPPEAPADDPANPDAAQGAHVPRAPLTRGAFEGVEPAASHHHHHRDAAKAPAVDDPGPAPANDHDEAAASSADDDA